MLSDESFMKTVDLVIAKYPEMFDALDEYDRTHKLRKINHKERANFTIDSKLLTRFRKYCKKRGMKMSAKIEQYMKNELEEF